MAFGANLMNVFETECSCTCACSDGAGCGSGAGQGYNNGHPIIFGDCGATNT